MKNIIIISLFYVSLAEAQWKIGKIINDSDIVFHAAYYIQPKEKEITGLTNNISKFSGNRELPIFYTVSNSSNGCCLIKGIAGDKHYTLVLDGNPTHALHRAKARQGSREKRFACKDYCKPGNYCARIFLDKDYNGLFQEIACFATEYTKEDTTFDVYIVKADNGSYAITLKESALKRHNN